MLRIRVGLIALLTVLSSVAALGQTPNDVMVGGLVTDDSKRGLTKITVRLRQCGNRTGIALETTTLDNGTFKIPVPSSAEWHCIDLSLIDSGTHHSGVYAEGLIRGTADRVYVMETVPQRAARGLDSMLDDLAAVAREGDEIAASEATATLLRLYPEEFPAGSMRAARADELRLDLPYPVRQLPLSGMNAALFMNVPGAIIQPGLRMNSFSVDGADYSPYFGQLIPVAGIERSYSDVSVYSAMRADGGGNVALKSGTNQFRESVSYTVQHEALNSNSKLNQSLGRPKTDHRRNAFGGSLSGPIRRGADFFFLSYEGLRARQEQMVFANVPPLGSIDALTAAGLERVAQLESNWNLGRRQDLGLVKTDHHLTSAHRLSLRYNHETVVTDGVDSPATQQTVETSRQTHASGNTGGVSWNGVLGNRAVNELNAQYAHARRIVEANSLQPHAEVREAGTLVLAVGSNVFAPSRTFADNVQVTNVFTWLPGWAEALKVGLEFQEDRRIDTFQANFAAAYIFDSLAAFGAGTPATRSDSITQAFSAPETAAPTTHPSIRNYSAYVQTDWRFRDWVTLNLGLRYRGEQFDLPQSRLALGGIAPRVGMAIGVTDSLQLRAAYGVFHSGTTSQMLATALGYDGRKIRTVTATGESGIALPVYPNRFAAIPPGTADVILFRFHPGFRNGRTQQVRAGVEYRRWLHSFGAQYGHSSGRHLPQTVDLDIGASDTGTFAVATTGQQLSMRRFAPGSSTDVSRLISLQSTARSERHEVTMNVARSDAQPLQYRASYTLATESDSLAHLSAFVPETSDDRLFPPDPSDPASAWANSDADVRHQLSAEASWRTDVPEGAVSAGVSRLLDNWSLVVRLGLQSGRPYSARVTTDINGDGNRYNDLAPGTTRNAFRFPIQSTVDLRISREFGRDVLRGRRLEVSLAARNLINRANYIAVNDTLYSVSGATLIRNPLFGQFVDQAPPRVVQLNLRFGF